MEVVGRGEVHWTETRTERRERRSSGGSGGSYRSEEVTNPPHHHTDYLPHHTPQVTEHYSASESYLQQEAVLHPGPVPDTVPDYLASP